jgi:glyceraldehyde-3-phosphate dehydrogenase (NADP+)
MVGDDRFKLLTFTGSSSVGWDMKQRAGRKRVLLELGGNAGAIIDESADLETAVARLWRVEGLGAGGARVHVTRSRR